MVKTAPANPTKRNSNQLGIDTTITEVMSSSSQSEHTKTKINNTLTQSVSSSQPNEGEQLLVEAEETSSYDKSAGGVMVDASAQILHTDSKTDLAPTPEIMQPT